MQPIISALPRTVKIKAQILLASCSIALFGCDKPKQVEGNRPPTNSEIYFMRRSEVTDVKNSNSIRIVTFLIDGTVVKRYQFTPSETQTSLWSKLKIGDTFLIPVRSDPNGESVKFHKIQATR